MRRCPYVGLWRHLGRVAVSHHSLPLLLQGEVVVVVAAARDVLNLSAPVRAVEVAMPRVPGLRLLVHDEADVSALGS